MPLAIQRILRFSGSSFLICLFLAGGVAFAQDQTSAQVQALAQRWAAEAVEASQANASPRLHMEVQVGAMDSRLKLAACGNMEAYVPPGARLWGRSRVGVRCIDGMSRWNITLPATVKAMGAAWVVKGQVLSGAQVGVGDLVLNEVDWAEDASPVIQDKAQWVGQVATRTLSTGQTLRQGMVKAAQVFQAGASVRVLAQGPGFEVSSDAQALSAGVIGQPARVRMDNGRITSGLVLDTKTVKIDI
jgi:flagella basal body P-ring formation protein FlgA